MEYQIPDMIGEPIQAWRTWFVVPENGTSGELRLQSIIYGKLWEPKTIHEAECRALTNPDRDLPSLSKHEAPEEGHNCGIYAVNTPEQVDRYYRDPTYRVREGFMEIWRVRGIVALWGKIIEGDKGYRAQYAYPVRIEVPRYIKGRELHLSPREVQIGLEHYCEVEIIDDTLRAI